MKKVKVSILINQDERAFLWDISKRVKLTPGELIISILRRHLKSRYRIPRKEWYYVVGK